MDMGLDGLWEFIMDREDWHVAVLGVAKCQTWLSDWTTMEVFLKKKKKKLPIQFPWFLKVDELNSFTLVRSQTEIKLQSNKNGLNLFFVLSRSQDGRKPTSGDTTLSQRWIAQQLLYTRSPVKQRAFLASSSLGRISQSLHNALRKIQKSLIWITSFLALREVYIHHKLPTFGEGTDFPLKPTGMLSLLMTEVFK